jgi:D-glycero-D-manno-heptose 1,7-bisphosphate phosphatase
MRRAAFLDRDGTINIEKEYLFRPEEFEFVPGAELGIKMFNDSGYLVVVVTNQSGVARGYYTEDDVIRLHLHIDCLLAKAGARVDAWLYCPHHPSGRGSYALPCRCRKPMPGMMLEAARRYGIALEQSLMIGDKLIDVEAAQAAGCRPILVRSGYGREAEQQLHTGVEVFENLIEAAAALTGHGPGI